MRAPAIIRRAWPLSLLLLVSCMPAGVLRAQTPAPSPAVATSPSAADDAQGYSAAQLYNRGNAFAREGRFALAVLAYERARVLAPADPDLRANLARARAAAGLPPGAAGWFERYGRFADPNVLYWLGILGLVLVGAAMLARRSRVGPRPMLLAAMYLGAAMVAASALDAAATSPVLSQSVVLSPAPAGPSPVEGADPLFTLPAADVVRVLDRHGAFALIRDAKGREGWVSASALASIIPSRPGSPEAKR